MTSTIRCIVLLSACSLWSACDESQPAATKPHAPGDVEQAIKPSLVAPVQALTAAAPEPLKSVADALAKQEPVAPKPSEESQPKPEPSDESFDRTLTASEVQVQRFVLARDVKGHEPLEVSDVFETDQKIFAFVQLKNQSAPFKFRVHWEPLEGPSSPYGVELKVPTAERFRTWSWTAIERKPGRYRAVLRTLAGEEIASRELTITRAPSE